MKAWSDTLRVVQTALRDTHMRAMCGTILAVCCITAPLAGASNPALTLMPVPQDVVAGQGRFRLAESTHIEVKSLPSDVLLWSASDRWLQTAKKRTGIAFDQKRITPVSSSEPGSIVIVAHRAVPVAIGSDESYSLTVTPDQVRIEAESDLGALRGLATLNQLIVIDPEGAYLPEVTIHDAPRFPWRGLMIDVSRHFLPIELLEKNIDAMEAVKLNVLHLHLSDDQGVRVASRLFPKLQEKASDGQYYTQDEIRSLVAYAQARGIVILPEFDMPGHSQSWFSAYPELSSTPGPFEPGTSWAGTGTGTTPTPEELMAAFTHAKTPAFDPTRETTYQFIDRFLGEMAGLFPSPYMHIGGDENNGVAWRSNPRITAFMKQHHMRDTAALQAYFIGRVSTLLEKHGKKMVAWEEAYAPGKFQNSMFQVWSTTPAVDLTKEHITGGNHLLISRGFYLDYFFPAAEHYLNPSLPANASPSAALPIFGGETAIWSEVEDRWNIDSRIWPRAAAVAERLWSPASVQDPDDMYRRLFVVNAELDQAGLDTVSSYERQIRRLAGNLPPAPLENFLNTLAPTPGFGRLFGLATLPPNRRDSFAPLNGVDDVALVDSEERYRFHSAWKQWQRNHDGEDEAILRAYLTSWSGCDTKLAPYFEQNRELKEVAQHAPSLAKLSAAALQSLGAAHGASAPGRSEVESLLKEADVSRAGTSIAILPDLKEMLSTQ